MSKHDERENVGEANVERLLAKAYRPEEPDADFAERVTQAMTAEAARRRSQVAHRRYHPLRRVIGWAVAATILLALGTALGQYFSTATQDADESQLQIAGERSRTERSPRPVAIRTVKGTRKWNVDSTLTPRPRSEGQTVPKLVVGNSLQTGQADRRRVELPDGSTLYLNRNTSLTLESSRRISLDRGEIYLEVAHTNGEQATNDESGRFTVVTPDRELISLGTKFNVRSNDKGTAVAVTQGKVQVSGIDEPLAAGQQLLPDSEGNTVPIGQTFHLIDWTRDLVTAYDSTLVPASAYSGGALVAKRPDGQEASLSMRQYKVDVHIEDGFARTTIDQTYFNEENFRLEGTFFFPLPPDASLSRLAMYVNGKLMEGGMAERQHARKTFESIVRKQKDPALLEWIDGSTFRMRVFPLEGRQEKRIVLSYTQRLQRLGDRVEYRFPGGHNMSKVGQWSCHVRAKNSRDCRWEADSYEFDASSKGKDLLLDAAAENVTPDRNVVVRLWDRDSDETNHGPRFVSAEHESHRYLALRYPFQPGGGRQSRRDWVFLYEASADRDPVLARVQVDVVKTLLENAERDDTFTLLAASSRIRAFADKPLPARPKNVRRAVEFLEKTQLVGALDLEKAFQAAADVAGELKNPCLVHLGSGYPKLGEDDHEALAELLPEETTYVGVAVGNQWNRALMKRLAGSSGGYFAQINPNEPVKWRAIELASRLNTPRLTNVRVVDDREQFQFLNTNDVVCEGEELVSIARLDADALLPKFVDVTGLMDGKIYSKRLSVEDVTDGADYLPRTWSKLKIDRMVADDAMGHHDEIVNLSMAMYVMSPFTSLLVLENEEMYAQYKVDRGRKDHWALYPCPETIKVVHEPMQAAVRSPAKPVAKTETAKASIEDALQTIVVRVRPNAPRTVWQLSQPHYSQFGPMGSGFTDGRHLWGFQPAEDLRFWSKPITDESAGWFRYVEGPIGPIISPDGEEWSKINLNTLRNTLDVDWDRSVTVGMAQPGVFSADLEVPFQAFPVVAADRRYVRVIPMPAFSEINDVPMFTFHDVSEFVGGGDFWSGMGLGMADSGSRIAWDMDNDGDGIPASQWMLSKVYPAADLVIPIHDDSYDAPDYANMMLGIRSQDRDEWLAAGEHAFILSEIEQRDVKIKQLVGRFNSLMAEGKYRYAEDAATMEAQRFNPFNVTGIPGTLNTQSTDYLADGLVLRVKRQKGVVDALRHVELAHVPFPDEPPITYPPAEVWRELTERRRNRYRSMDLIRPGFTEKHAREALDEKTTAAFIDEPLSGVIDFWKDYHNVEIQIATGYLIEAGISPVAKVTCNLTGISLRAALRLVLSDLKLTYVIQNDGSLLILPPKHAERFLIRNRYTQHRAPAVNDLLIYAPAMHTTRADVLAVLDAEAKIEGKPRAGRIDAKARRLIERSRRAGWRRLATEQNKGLHTDVVFDGQGRFRIESETALGLKESAFCDGEHLWHLYPEIGVGAKRPNSRFYGNVAERLIPWLLPSVEELARGADVVAVAERTVAVVPCVPDELKEQENESAVLARASGWYELRLVFAKNGRLAERQIVRSDSGDILLRETYDADGTVRLLDADGKERVKQVIATEPCEAPDLEPDPSLVVLPMPWRTREHVFAARGLKDDGAHKDWTREDALAVLAAETGGKRDSILSTVGWCFLAKGDRRPGLYTLLLSAGVDWEAKDDDDPHGVHQLFESLKSNTEDPIARYVTTLKSGKKEIGPLGDKGDGFVCRLAKLHDLWAQWQQSTTEMLPQDYRKKIERETAELVKQDQTMAFAASAMAAVAQHGGSEAVARVGDATETALRNGGPAAFSLRFLHAEAVAKHEQVARGRQLFRSLVNDMLDSRTIPRIDPQTKNTFFPNSHDHSIWRGIVERITQETVKHTSGGQALTVAVTLHDLGETESAERIFAAATTSVSPRSRGPETRAAVSYLWRTEQQPRAEAMLAALLENDRYSEVPALWHLASQMAEQQGRPARAAECLDRALALQFDRLPQQVDLNRIRTDYGKLLGLFGEAAEEGPRSNPQLQDSLISRVVSSADRWRSLDPESAEVCRLAGAALARFGAVDLAWDYVTSPLAMDDESPDWPTLGTTYHQQGQYDLAERAYELACQGDPTNADLLWKRARVLIEADRREEANDLLETLAAGSWKPEYRRIQEQAKTALSVGR